MILDDSTLFTMFVLAIAVLAVLTLNCLRRYVVFKSMDKRFMDDPEMQAVNSKLSVEFPASRELKKAMLYGAATVVVVGVVFTF